jgi:hypothetical protein
VASHHLAENAHAAGRSLFSFLRNDVVVLLGVGRPNTLIAKRSVPTPSPEIHRTIPNVLSTI